MALANFSMRRVCYRAALMLALAGAVPLGMPVGGSAQAQGGGGGRGRRGGGAGGGAAAAGAAAQPAPAGGGGRGRGGRGAGGFGAAAGGAAAVAAPAAALDDRPYNYPPQLQVDMEHLKLDITPDFRKRTIDGQVSLTYKVLTQPLDVLRLDSVDLDIHSVKFEGKDLPFTTQDDQLLITFNPPLEVGKEATVDIAYHGQPKKGVFFRTKEMGYPETDEHLFTQGEEEDTRYWIPCYDHPNDKLTTEITAHYPADMVCGSNGHLVEETGPVNGMKTSHWKEDHPMSNYLIALVIGKFKVLEGKHKDLPLLMYVPTSEAAYAAPSFDITDDILSFEEEFTGLPFPWEKYGQVMAEDFVEGGMENASLTIYTDSTLHPKEYEPARNSESLMSHETMHQWFGDLVTCSDWSHTWLNEGFATLGQNLYQGHKDGNDQLLYLMYTTLRTLGNSEINDQLPIDFERYRASSEQFGQRSYAKAGWVLYMLREYLGHDLFHDCIKAYLTKYAYQPVDLAAFKGVFEEVSHQPLDRFFDQWFQHGGMPDLAVSYNWDPGAGMAHLTVDQNQPVSDNVPLYYIPTKVRFYLPSGPVDKPIVIDKKTNEYSIPLPAAPLDVRFDPTTSIMARTAFNLPMPMMLEQARHKDDMVGRLIAVNYFSNNANEESVAELARMVKEDPFYAVRVDAARALGSLRTDAAYDALMAATEQPDERAANAVLAAIGGFYRDDSLKMLKDTIAKNANPLMTITAIGELAKFAGKEDISPILRQELAADSFHDEIASAAINAMRDTSDTKYVPDLLKKLEGNHADFPERAYIQAMQSLVALAEPLRSDDADKKQIYDFLVAKAGAKDDDPRITAGAIQALGSLGDRRALPMLQAMDAGRAGDPVQAAARNAVTTIQNATANGGTLQELNTLRDQVDALSRRLDQMNGVDTGGGGRRGRGGRGGRGGGFGGGNGGGAAGGGRGAAGGGNAGGSNGGGGNGGGGN